jgi:hypothetical protein
MHRQRPAATLLSLGRVAAKAIHCFVVTAAVACVLCWRVIPDAIGWQFWVSVWFTVFLLTEPVAVFLYWSSRRSPEVSRPAAEWLRAVGLAAVPSGVLILFWVLMWVTFRGGDVA